MPTLQIKNFRGVNLKEGTWQQGFAKYVVGIDTLGVQDNTDDNAIPGVLKGMKVMAAGTEAASTNDITDLARRFALNPAISNNPWAVGDGTRIYERVGTTWTLRFSSTDLAASRNTTDGGGIFSFNDSLWLATNGDLNRITDQTTIVAPYNDGSDANFSSTTSSSRPGVIFADALYIGNNNFISKLDSSLSFTAAKLTLDSVWTIGSMEVYRNRIYITADNGQSSRVWVWDGQSANVDVSFDLPDQQNAPFLKYFDGLLWLIGSRPSVNNTNFSPIYVFDGGRFEKLFELPVGIQEGRDVATVYRGNLLIASSDSSSPSYEDGVAGVWMIGKKSSGEPYEAVIAHNPSNGVSDTTLGGVFAVGSAIYVGTTNGSSSADEIWELQTSDQNTAGIWSSNPIDAGNISNIKIWHGIQLDTELDQDTFNINRTVTVAYRVDQASSFTTIKTIQGIGGANIEDPHAYLPIGAVGRNIEIRLTINTSGNIDTTRVRGFFLDYTETTR